MKLDIYYDSETDTLSLWNGRPASEGADVAENLIVDFGRDGEVVGFTLDHAAELLGSVLSMPVKRSQATKTPSERMTDAGIAFISANSVEREMEDSITQLLDKLNIRDLSIEERIQLVGEIWDSIVEESEAFELTDAER